MFYDANLRGMLPYQQNIPGLSPVPDFGGQEYGGGGRLYQQYMQPPMLPQAPQAQPQAQMPQAPSLANLYQQGMAPQQDGRMFGMWMR